MVFVFGLWVFGSYFGFFRPFEDLGGNEASCWWWVCCVEQFDARRMLEGQSGCCHPAIRFWSLVGSPSIRRARYRSKLAQELCPNTAIRQLGSSSYGSNYKILCTPLRANAHSLDNLFEDRDLGCGYWTGFLKSINFARSIKSSILSTAPAFGARERYWVK